MSWRGIHSSEVNMGIVESLKVLNELGEISVRVPGVLEAFIPCLLQIIASPHAKLRGLGYVLLLQYVNFCPASSSVIIPGFLSCFSGSVEVQSEALQNAHSFFFFAQDHSSVFLRELFDVGVAAAPVFKGILSAASIF